MKYEDDEIISQSCQYCHEEIFFKPGFVVKNGKYYHLECYHIMIDVPLEVEAEEINDDEEIRD